MVKFDAREIKGAWKKGYALDIHTISSMLIGYTPNGYAQFDTKRTELGQLIFQLKNRSDKSAVDPIATTAASFVSGWKPGVDLIVPVPPTSKRAVKPTLLIAEALAKLGRNVVYCNCITLTRDPGKALKNVDDPEERNALLAGLYTIDSAITKGKRILLLDDLYRSGATMNAVTDVLLDKGKAAHVVALAITCTRSKA